MGPKSWTFRSHITGKSHHNGKSSAMYNTNFRTDLVTFMYNGFQKLMMNIIMHAVGDRSSEGWGDQ